MAASRSGGADIASAAAAAIAPAHGDVKVRGAPERQAATTATERDDSSQTSDDSSGTARNAECDSPQRALHTSDSVLTLVRSSDATASHSNHRHPSAETEAGASEDIPDQRQQSTGVTSTNKATDHNHRRHQTDRHVAPLASLDCSITESIGMASQASSGSNIIDTPTLSRYFESDHMSDIVDGSLFEITNIGCLSRTLAEQPAHERAYQSIGIKGGDNQAAMKRQSIGNRDKVSASSCPATRRSNNSDDSALKAHKARDAIDTCDADGSNERADRLASAIRKEYETSRRLQNDRAVKSVDCRKKGGKKMGTSKRGFKFNLFSFLGVGLSNDSSGDSADGDEGAHDANHGDHRSDNDNEYQSVQQQQQQQQVKHGGKQTRAAAQCPRGQSARPKKPDTSPAINGRSQMASGLPQHSHSNKRHRLPGRSAGNSSAVRIPTKNVRDSIKLTNQRKLRSSSSSRPSSTNEKSNELLLNLSSSPSNATGTLEAVGPAIRPSHSAHSMGAHQSASSYLIEPSRNRAASHSAGAMKPAKSVKFTTPDEVLILSSSAMTKSCSHQFRPHNSTNGHAPISTFTPSQSAVAVKGIINGSGAQQNHLPASVDMQPVVPIIKRSSLPKSSSYSQTESNKTLDELLAKYESNQDLVRAINEKLHLSETIASPLSTIDDVMFLKKCTSDNDLDQQQQQQQQSLEEDEAASIDRLSALNDATRYQLWQQEGKSEQDYHQDHTTLLNGTEFEQRISTPTTCEALE